MIAIYNPFHIFLYHFIFYVCQLSLLIQVVVILVLGMMTKFCMYLDT